MRDKMFYYKIYGLIVKSEIEIPQAYEIEPEELEKIDVDIVYGKMYDFMYEHAEKGYGTWTSKFDCAWFWRSDSGHFMIEGGKRITIDVFEDANILMVQSMILSAGFALVILQRNEVCFHGSCLEYGKKAFAVCGESGAGKSTVTMELLKSNYGFLADDTFRVHSIENKYMAEPTYPQQKVCRDMAEHYGLDLNSMIYIDEERDKFALSRRERFVDRECLLSVVFILKKDGDACEVTVNEISGGEYIKSVIDNLYLADTYKNIVGIPPEFMMQIFGLSSQVKIYEICRPVRGNSVPEIVSQILQLLQLC